MKPVWSQQRRQQSFWRSLSGISIGEFMTLLKVLESPLPLYIYDAVNKCSVQPLASQVPWPLVYLLCCHHRKHVFNLWLTPPLSTIGSALRTWGDKLRWLIALRDNVDVDSPYNLSRVKVKGATPMGPPAPPNFERFIDAVQTAAFDRACSARSSARIHKWSNVSPIIKLGLSCLRHGRWGSLPTDKDGGIALVDKVALGNAKASLVQAGSYVEIPRFSDTEIPYVECYVAVVAKIFRSNEDPLLRSALLSGLRRWGTQGMFSFLDATVKTHKHQYEQVLRPIHCCTRHPFRPGMKFIASLITPTLRRLPHLCSSTDDLIRMLGKTVVPASSRMYKVDIRDFHMSGAHRDLSDRASKLVEDPDFRWAFVSLCDAILTAQLVTFSGEDHRCWRVTAGSGMGLPCSSPISSATFYDMAERDFTQARSVRNEFGVILYSRYEDDLFIVLDAPRATRLEFFRQFKLKSSFFRLKVEEVSSVSLEVLDITIFRGPRWVRTGCLDYRSFKKPTSIHRPLSPHSCHAPGVHLAWPLAEVLRINKRSHSIAHRKAAVQTFRSTYMSCFGFFPVQVPRPIHSQPKFGEHSLPRVVIPFSWVWGHANFPSVFRAVCRDFGFLLEGSGFDPSILIAWALGHKHLLKVLKGSNDVYHGQLHQLFDFFPNF